MTASAPDIDTVGMFALTAGLPEQAEDAAQRAAEVAVALDAATVENVVVAGMGGSGITGDILSAVCGPLLPVPVLVCKSYECPAFVGPETLFFAVSASGNTEETIQSATDAEAAGAQLVVVTGGGQLGSLARSWGAPVVDVPPIPQPRAALGAMAIPPIVVLDRLGLFRGGRTWVAAAVEQLKRRRDQIEAAGDSSEPAAVARRIGRTIPLIHGGGAVGAAAAQRWKTQVNENAKTPAFWSAQPELCHNEIAGWGQNGDVTRQVLTAVALRHEGEHPQVGRRFELVAELLREVVADMVEVHAAGEGDLAQLLDLVIFGDYVSLWMAAQAGVDPGPVPALDELKSALAG
ncbi:MAG TPA: bifunctional phosphoglucose/phosphomannose isomerase [Acidimicrobiales bacterium]|nr:bifunctional phosphoglucose/phosphomannose isomerase [Acidimicrobiales bacterium]